MRLLSHMVTSGWLLLPIAGVIGLLSVPSEWYARVVVGVVAFALFVLMTVVRYRRLVRSDGLVSVRETRRRLLIPLPDAALLDPKQRILGMYRAGQPYSYVWVAVDEETLDTHFLALRRRWPYLLGEHFEGPNLASVAEALTEHQIDLLPQGSYANSLWESRFAWLVSGRSRRT